MTTPSHNITRFSGMFVIAGIALVLAGIGVIHVTSGVSESADMTTMEGLIAPAPGEQPTPEQGQVGPVGTKVDTPAVDAEPVSQFLWGKKFFTDSEREIKVETFRCKSHLLADGNITESGTEAGTGRFEETLWGHERDLARHVNLVKYVDASEPERIIDYELGAFIERVRDSTDRLDELFGCYLDTRIPQEIGADSQSTDEKILAAYKFENMSVPRSCVLFCDHTGYEPGWVEDYRSKSTRAGGFSGYGHDSVDGSLIALWNKCSSTIREDPRGGSNDGRWCMEFNDQGLDDMRRLHESMGPPKCEVFCSSVAYEPDWVTGDMDHNGILDMCQGITGDPTGYETADLGLMDLSWCSQFIGHVLDGMGENAIRCDMCDYSQHRPDWITAGMDQEEILHICRNTTDGSTYTGYGFGSQDWYWCEELVDRVDSAVEAGRIDYARILSEASCNMFCDHTGYEPAWVTENMWKNRALGICEHSMDADEHGSMDWNWCNEFVGHMEDNLNVQAKTNIPTEADVFGLIGTCNLFCDHTGYEPIWVTKNMGQNRALSICENNMYIDERGSKDWNWCNGFLDHLADELNAPAGTN